MRVLTDTESYSMEQWADNDPSQSTRESVRCVIQQDASPIRGVAGVLADATTEMADDDYIIVTSGAQVFLEPLDDLVYAMAKKNADVAFVSSKDGAPVGLWLIRCGVLRSVNSIGYVDLKEQALDEWKQNHKVCVVERPRAYAHPTRSLVEYLGAIRADVVGVRSGSTIDQDPYREDWESTFSIIEPRAQVNEAALLHDSIALQNSSVGKGAVVVRSVICPGATVSPGARVHDMVVTGVIKKERGR
ncbi:MAG: hypothetical protein JKX70_04435 [Phycisphaerales bacterium]|nr:hypothetical protein [Phycisphaerales bacterium]